VVTSPLNPLLTTSIDIVTRTIVGWQPGWLRPNLRIASVYVSNFSNSTMPGRGLPRR
jgi:hypothetical protein